MLSPQLYNPERLKPREEGLGLIDDRLLRAEVKVSGPPWHRRRQLNVPPIYLRHVEDIEGEIILDGHRRVLMAIYKRCPISAICLTSRDQITQLPLDEQYKYRLGIYFDSAVEDAFLMIARYGPNVSQSVLLDDLNNLLLSRRHPITKG